MLSTVPGTQSVLYKYYYYYCKCSINVAIFNTRENIFVFPKGVLSPFVDLECAPQETSFPGEPNESIMDFKDLGFPEVI